MGVPIEFSKRPSFTFVFTADFAQHQRMVGFVTVYCNSYSSDMSLFSAVIRAWNSVFYGNADAALLRAVDRLHSLPVESNYAKIIPITQSSGTGKSKTVDAIDMKRITFPMCIRENLGNDAFGARN
jgi:hypothetical protein